MTDFDDELELETYGETLARAVLENDADEYVWVLAVDFDGHRHLWVFWEEFPAKRQLYLYVKENWTKELGEMPDDEDEAVEAFEEYHSDVFSFSLTREPVLCEPIE